MAGQYYYHILCTVNVSFIFTLMIIIPDQSLGTTARKKCGSPPAEILYRNKYVHNILILSLFHICMRTPRSQVL